MTQDDVAKLSAGIKQVRHKPTPHLAVQLTEANIDLVVDWIKGANGWAERLATGVELLSGGRSYLVRYGDYVIQGDGGEFHYVTAERFANYYEDVVQDA